MRNIYLAGGVLSLMIFLGAGCVQNPKEVNLENQQPVSTQVNTKSQVDSVKEEEKGLPTLDNQQKEKEVEKAIEPEKKSPQISAIDAARVKCKSLQGEPSVKFSELYGENQIFCSFGGGECTQNELNTGDCFMETNALFRQASNTCAKLGGRTYLTFSEASGENEVFCSFGDEGECTQRELNDQTCFKE